MLISSFNRKECYPPECRGGPEEESIHFQFYGSKIGRTANFQSSNSIPHCLFLPQFQDFPKF